MTRTLPEPSDNRSCHRRRLGAGPDAIRAIYLERAESRAECQAAQQAAKDAGAAARRDPAAAPALEERARARCFAAWDRGNRAGAAMRAIAWLDPAAAARLQAADRLLDESVRATLARRAGDPGDPDLLAAERAARARWMAAVSVANDATVRSVTRAVHGPVARCADAAPRRLPRSRSRRRHRSSSSRPAAARSTDPDPEGRQRRASSSGGAS